MGKKKVKKSVKKKRKKKGREKRKPAAEGRFKQKDKLAPEAE